ncbi:hypothetical protein C8R44DRAFT_751072 [Mycena epipterygia]|nr:hypothetical protein C8R44DRAFT_751072 [Mycena epipterygia]
MLTVESTKTLGQSEQLGYLGDVPTDAVRITGSTSTLPRQMRILIRIGNGRRPSVREFIPPFEKNDVPPAPSSIKRERGRRPVRKVSDIDTSAIVDKTQDNILVSPMARLAGESKRVVAKRQFLISDRDPETMLSVCASWSLGGPGANERLRFGAPNSQSQASLG